MDNQVFNAAFAEDLDRIDVLIASSNSDLQSTDSRHNLTSATTNFRYTHETAHQAQEELPKVVSDCNLRRRQITEAARRSPNCHSPTNMMRRWSQHISRYAKDKHSIREKAIHRLPSRKIYEVDGKLLSASNHDPETEIEELAKEIEQHECLMQDTELAKQNRLDTLRALPQSLAVKRLLKQKLSITIEQQSTDEQKHKLRHFLGNYCVRIALKMWALLGIICSSVEIWYDALKTIEGHFGSNVGSFFKFLRWLFVVNLVQFTCTFAFITLPQILFNLNVGVEVPEGEFKAKHINQSEMAMSMKLSEMLSAEAVIKPDTGTTVQILNMFTGEGALKSSLLFYGGYSNVTFAMRNSQHIYNIPNAYFMTMLMLYLFTFVVISTSMARSYRRSFIETSGGLRSLYAHKIFCSWDFGIANRKAAELKHFSIYTELKELLSELKEPKEPLSLVWRIWIIFLKSLAHLLVCSMIAGLGFAIWILLKKFSENNEISPWRALYVPTVINLSMLFFQAVFAWIAKMEDYRSPRRALHITLVRNFLLEALVMGVLVYFWLTKKRQICWETYIGQEIYRLMMTDFFISLFFLPLISWFRVFVLARYSSKCDLIEFSIPQRSVGLVFNQTLLWMGLLFAPLLSAFIVLKMFLLFYVNKATVLHLCKSPRHVWRSSQTHTLYLVFTFLSLLGVIIALGYIMTQVPLSGSCGPFRNYMYMFEIFIDGVLKLRNNHKIWRLLMTLIRPAMIGLMLVIMAIMVYYLRAKARARCMMVDMLKEMLYWESKDKAYLLANITNITKDHEWLFEKTELDAATAAAAAAAASVEEAEAAEAADRYAESCNTWRYARGQKLHHLRSV